MGRARRRPPLGRRRHDGRRLQERPAAALRVRNAWLRRATNAVLFVSLDKGATWIENKLPARAYDPATEDSIFIGAIDPVNADLLYLRSSGQATGGQSRLTKVQLGADGGAATFSTAHVFIVDGGPNALIGEMLGLALSADGSKIYIGSTESGLWVAQTSDLKFTKTSSVEIQCLATRGDELWACGPAKDGFIIGRSTDDGKNFTTMLDLIGDLTGAIRCQPNPAGAACHRSAAPRTRRSARRGRAARRRTPAHRQAGANRPTADRIPAGRPRRASATSPSSAGEERPA
jgi:hypothetical protein